ncbi:acyl-CoA synthetase [Oceanobacillus salinisoli]|uniref:acyl-CoA synthetase n=1 Tax=Oceanobacillus salinisoli TaxID=2678611 RepID=UPI0012E10232|nr:long-chain fatty acid--CoA ligase [Oceanobacillus salinisoli]
MHKGIGNWLVKHAYYDSERLALVYKDKRFTYKQFNERVNELANAFVEMGIRKGERVNALLYNTNEMLESMFACSKIGAIFVPINYRLSVEEVYYIVNDSTGSLFIYDSRMRTLVDELRNKKSSIREYIHVGNNPHDADFLYEEVLSSSSKEEPGYDVALDDVHIMMYTSGTTGRPKGAMLTHGNTLWNAINMMNYLPVQQSDTTIGVAPLFHIGGMSCSVTPLFYKGGTVFLDDVFNPESVLQKIQDERITFMFLVPAMWQALTEVKDFEKYDLSSLRICECGGAPCPIPVIEKFQEKGVEFYEGFGLTETAPFVSLLDSKNSLRKHGSVGKTPMHVEVRIVDEYDRDVPVGDVGELVVKGPNVMKGYWNKPEATREAIRDGWFHTGDLAKFDEENFIYIVDRMKDMIITGGENVYPIEIEQHLYKHPNIREVAVIGYPDQKWGESIKVIASLKDSKNTITLDDIRDYLDGKVARFKLPKQLEVVEELPRNATGKILKMALRERVAQTK